MRLDELTAADFEPRVGEPFTIAADPEPIELVLESARVLADRPGGRDPFSLQFRGPVEPLLAQAIYPLEHAELGLLEIFIVPHARDDAGAVYGAVFS